MGTCQYISSDLLHNKHWSTAYEIELSGMSLVAGREFSNSPLVIFIPVRGKVSLSTMSNLLDRIKQLSLDISTGQVDIESLAKPLNNMNMSQHGDCKAVSGMQALQNDCVPGNLRFTEDKNFDRDKCLRLHHEVLEMQVLYEMKDEELSRKHARTEERRLGLLSDDTPIDMVPQGSDPQRPSVVLSTTSTENSDNSHDIVDIHTSTMFVFGEGSTLSYFQAAQGLVPPYYCPEDSDDEKPLEVVQDEQRKLELKRKLKDQ